jgi:hypothetical protein
MQKTSGTPHKELVENLARPENQSSGAKALADFAAFTARLKSFPDTIQEFFNKFPSGIVEPALSQHGMCTYAVEC